MRREVETLLRDIETAAQKIQEYVAGMTFEQYAASSITQSAVERQFITIGEAMNSLYKLDAPLAARLPSSRQVVDFRNVLVHAYALIRDDRVWGIAVDDLPRLLAEVQALLPSP